MGNPYYEDEYEDYDDYEDYHPDEWCPYCLERWEYCNCFSQEESFCDCGAVIDEHGFCPYCDYAPVDDQELLNWLPGIGEE